MHTAVLLPSPLMPPPPTPPCLLTSSQDIEHGCLVEGLCALLLGLGVGLQQRLVAMVAAYSKTERQRCEGRGGRRRGRGRRRAGPVGEGEGWLQQRLVAMVAA